LGEFAVLLFIEPRAFDIEEIEPGHEARQRQRVDRGCATGRSVRASGL